jgi:cytochrome b
MSEDAARSRFRIRVWDLPTRILHWLLVVLVPLSWWTAETERMDWHRYSGYTLLGLVGFRIYWGFFGSSTARFARFVTGPRTVVNYLKGTWTRVPGHNPLGAWSVLALLALLATQIALGLFAVDVDGIESGPLSRFVSFEAGRASAGWHEDVFDVLLAFIALHLVAVAYYLVVRKQDLVSAMVHGQAPHSPDAPGVVGASVTRFVVGVALAGVLVWLVARL